MRLVRTIRGKVIHKPDCVDALKAKKKTDWAWALDMPPSMIKLAIVALGYHECHHCKPMEGL